MSHQKVVFVGPSSKRTDVFDGWDVQPPAKAGDIVNYVIHNSSVEIIVIVDGYFFEEFAVLHREISEVLESGYTVIGCSSMGALRAVEMKSCGMIGFGDVYNFYKENPETGDDEVGLLHELAQGGYRHLTLPLINLRILAKETSDQELKSDLELVIEYLSTLSFCDRDWRSVNECMIKAIGTESSGRVKRIMRSYVDFKHSDLVRTIREAESLVLPRMDSESFSQVEIDRSLNSVKSGESDINEFVLAPYINVRTKGSMLEKVTMTTLSLRDITVLDPELHSELLRKQLYRQLLLAEGIRNCIAVGKSDFSRFLGDFMKRRRWGSFSSAYQETYLTRSGFARYIVREYIISIVEELMISSQGNSFAISSYLDSMREVSSIDDIMGRASVIGIAIMLDNTVSALGIDITRKLMRQNMDIQDSIDQRIDSFRLRNLTKHDLQEILDRWSKTCRD